MRVKWLVVAASCVGAVALVAFLVMRGPTPQPTASRAAEPQGTVLLIPGYGGGTGQLDALARELRSEGIVAEVVDVGDGQGDLRQYARKVEDRARTLIAAGDPAPDVVGYSAGGVTARIAATDDPALFRRVVTFGAPLNGTTTADAGALFGQCPPACQQLRTESDLLEGLPAPTDPSDWLSVWSDTDEVIRPVESSVLPDIGSYRIQEFCAGTVEHGRIPTHPQSVAALSAFLSDQPLPTSCVVA